MQLSKKVNWNQLIQKFAMPLFLLVLMVAFQLFNLGENLLVWDNLKTILLQVSVLAFLSLGLSFVMIVGEVDISFAGTMGMMSAMFTLLVSGGWNYFAALAVVVFVGAFIGLLMSLVVTKVGFSGFIVSIAFMFMGLGIERSFKEGITIWLENEAVLSIGRLDFLNVYIFTWVMLLFFVVAYILIMRTKFGFDLRITGENQNAALEVGVKINAIKIAAFVIAGALYGLAAMTEPIRYGGAIVGAGQIYIIPALAACFLGSTMFKPGRVNVAGTLVGSLFMILISNFMQLLAYPFYFIPIVQGVVLIIAVGLSVVKNKGKIQQVKL